MSGDTMSSFVTAITNSTNGLTSSALWTEAANAVPLIVAVAIFAFGYNIVRRCVKGAAKGKLKM